VDEITSFVRAVLERAREHDAAEKARYAGAEAEGYKIIDGGQESPQDDDGKCDWVITDFRTGTALAISHGTLDDYDKALDDLEAELGQPLCHVDNLTEEVANAESKYLECPPSSLPGSLAEALQEWAWDHEDDARAWVAAQG
jgi:hypothetical protein